MELYLLSIDEGISGYRDHSLEEVKFHSETYGLHLKILSYKGMARPLRGRKPLLLHRCWWRMLETKCVGDNFKMLVTVFCHFGPQHPLFFYISVRHQHSKDVTKIEIPTPTSKNGHQLQVTNITVTILFGSSGSRTSFS